MTLYASVLDLIGNTPLVDISALSPNPSVRILVKLEGSNPGGSVKDRVALVAHRGRRAARVLFPGEPTSSSSRHRAIPVSASPSSAG